MSVKNTTAADCELRSSEITAGIVVVGDNRHLLVAAAAAAAAGVPFRNN